MDYTHRLSISYYKVAAPINEAHKVYLVRHQETGKFYVRKTLDVFSAEVYEELRSNPVRGIPRIVDFCEEDGKLTLIEEFISGKTLREIFDEAGAGRILTTETIGHYMIGLCEILIKLHSMDPPIIHRDLKPSNIIVTGYDNVYLLDYNAARHYRRDAERDTDTKLLGTQGYAAPEQYGFGQSSPQTDIYSLGKILQEAVQYLPAQDYTFDKIIRKCTQMDPAKRYAGAAELRAALRKSLGISERTDIRGIVVNPYLPPGFRTLNPFKMLIAVTVYYLIFYTSLTLTTKDISGTGLWVERVSVLMILLAGVAIGSNYLNVQRMAPFHGSNYRALRIAGVIALLLAVTGSMFLILIMVISVAFV